MKKIGLAIIGIMDIIGIVKKAVVLACVIGLSVNVAYADTQGRQEPREGVGEMKITSPQFGNNDFIPKKYTCQGDDINPPLAISGAPRETKSFALIVDDPDAPGRTWVHWVVFDIPFISEIPENSIPGKQGINDFGKRNYGGPCPPSGMHRYFFKLYALKSMLNIREGTNKRELENAMQGHILEEVELVGLYEKR
ncbi:MAG: YbhB/YbcL family Raf kinase inhibitor-like protein [Omnitrophica bacterium]|nr:YbhB/YbcL family Raf kinase inhibitor-like protein [Candidatus Omnitrophota bacterium]